jgi:hypothetical protein
MHASTGKPVAVTPGSPMALIYRPVIGRIRAG